MSSKPVEITLLLVGPSQAGKSSSANLLGAQNAVGSNGLSETKKVGKVITEDCPLYPGKTVMIIDTIGFNDTNLKTQDEILWEIKQYMLESKVDKIDQIFLVESFSNDTIKFNSSYLNLQQYFGNNINKSITILTTKSNVTLNYCPQNLSVGQEMLDTRKEIIQDFIKQNSIRGGQVDFQTVFTTKLKNGQEEILYNPSDNQRQQQLQKLKQAIYNTQPYDLRKEFEEYDKEIERRIQELKKTMRIKTEIDVKVQKVKLHTETRTQNYTVEIPYVKTKKFLGVIPIGTKSGSNTIQKSFNYEITVPEIYTETEKQKHEIEYAQEFYRQEALKQFNEQKRKEIQAKQQFK